jgi:catechol-2,3-dioxygenase
MAINSGKRVQFNMPISDIDHYNLRLPKERMDETLWFYTTILGLTVGPRPLKSFGYWLYAANKSILHISQALPEEQREVDKKNAIDHIAFACTDLANFEKVLQTHEIDYKRNEIAGIGQVQLFLQDPMGNKVELNFS